MPSTRRQIAWVAPRGFQAADGSQRSDQLVAGRRPRSPQACSRCREVGALQGSGCKEVIAHLAFSEHALRCGHCGLGADRDPDAAANLALLGRPATRTASPAAAGNGAALRRAVPPTARETDRFMPLGSCPPGNRDDGSTAAPGSVAWKRHRHPAMGGSDALLAASDR